MSKLLFLLHPTSPNEDIPSSVLRIGVRYLYNSTRKKNSFQWGYCIAQNTGNIRWSDFTAQNYEIFTQKLSNAPKYDPITPQSFTKSLKDLVSIGGLWDSPTLMSPVSKLTRTPSKLSKLPASSIKHVIIIADFCNFGTPEGQTENIIPKNVQKSLTNKKISVFCVNLSSRGSSTISKMMSKIGGHVIGHNELFSSLFYGFGSLFYDFFYTRMSTICRSSTVSVIKHVDSAVISVLELVGPSSDFFLLARLGGKFKSKFSHFFWCKYDDFFTSNLLLYSRGKLWLLSGSGSGLIGELDDVVGDGNTSPQFHVDYIDPIYSEFSRHFDDILVSSMTDDILLTEEDNILVNYAKIDNEDCFTPNVSEIIKNRQKLTRTEFIEQLHTCARHFWPEETWSDCLGDYIRENVLEDLSSVTSKYSLRQIDVDELLFQLLLHLECCVLQSTPLTVEQIHSILSMIIFSDGPPKVSVFMKDLYEIYYDSLTGVVADVYDLFLMDIPAPEEVGDQTFTEKVRKDPPKLLVEDSLEQSKSQKSRLSASYKLEKAPKICIPYTYEHSTDANLDPVIEQMRGDLYSHGEKRGYSFSHHHSRVRTHAQKYMRVVEETPEKYQGISVFQLLKQNLADDFACETPPKNYETKSILSQFENVGSSFYGANVESRIVKKSQAPKEPPKPDKKVNRIIFDELFED